MARRRHHIRSAGDRVLNRRKIAISGNLTTFLKVVKFDFRRGVATGIRRVRDPLTWFAPDSRKLGITLAPFSDCIVGSETRSLGWHQNAALTLEPAVTSLTLGLVGTQAMAEIQPITNRA